MEIPAGFSGGRTMRVLLGLSFLLVPVALLAQSPVGNAADEAAIRQIVEKYLAAREGRDAQAIEALLTKDADQLVSTGEWRKGRSEIVRGALASSQRRPGERTITVESIRFVAPGVALADGRYEITGPAGGESRKMWTTLLVTRVADGWRIAAIRNMLPAA